MLLKWWLREFAVSGRHVKKGGVLMWIDMLLASSCPPCEKVRLLISVAYLFIFLTSHPTLLDDVLHVSSYLQSALLQDLSGFDVSVRKGNNHFKLRDSPAPIPLELFRFHSYEQLQALANTNIEFLGLFLIFFIPTSLVCICKRYVSCTTKQIILYQTNSIRKINDILIFVKQVKIN
ncbi:hypothetical protein Bca4012_046527 [Brassica carinata]|uniref:Uncharacterized protein n=1 Tax=Brassica carinata TaxID=52824 RepID=A0A8X7QTH6_BRACI|nr:hypothetical protein Bca52824_056765 [Brassica carinata]